MQKTENLELNIIEGTDIPAYAPFNENAEKLDTAYKNHATKIDSMEKQLTTLEGVPAELDKVAKTVGEVQDIATYEKIVINGVEQKALKHRAKIEVLQGSYGAISLSCNVKQVGHEENEQYLGLSLNLTSLTLNLTELFGIGNDYADKIVINSVQSYADNYLYQGATNPIPLGVQYIGKNPNAGNGIYMGLYGTRTNGSLTKVSTGQNTIPAYRQEGNLIVVIEYLELVD